MSKIGYARVSSKSQSLEIQLDKLKDCEKIFQEKTSGYDKNQLALKKCLEYVRPGDVLMVSRLDRLARSTLHLCKIADLLHQKDVVLRVLDQNIDTSDATGRLLFNMLGAIAQFETEVREERQSEGIRNALNRGVKFGRKRTITDEQVIEMKSKRKKGSSIKELMKEYNLGKGSIYQWLKR